MDAEALGQLKAEAWRRLVAVDHVDAKAADEGLTISPLWRAWRVEVRAVIRGERLDIPDEPARYADAVTPVVSEPAPVVKKILVAVAEPEPVPLPPPSAPEPDEIPIDLVRYTEPDETLIESRIRLLKTLADMRSMISGRIEMAADQWTLYNILESQAAQSWLNKGA